MKRVNIRIQHKNSFCATIKVNLLSRKFWQSVCYINNMPFWRRLIDYVSWQRRSKCYSPRPLPNGYFIVVQENHIIDAILDWRKTGMHNLNTIIDTLAWHIHPDDEFKVSVLTEKDMVELLAAINRSKRSDTKRR